MEKYRIVVKPVYREKFTGIMCFLADPQYTDRDIQSGNNRTKALCWVAYKEDIEKLMNKYQNIKIVIASQLLKWEIEYKDVMEELTPIASADQLREMTAIMVNFIKDTISSSYD